MRKIVINACHGGFGLSRKAKDHIIAAKGIDPGEWQETWSGYPNFDDWNLARDDPHLVEAVELLGAASAGSFADLKVVEIPDDVEWNIQEYDGLEWIAEKHRTWN